MMAFARSTKWYRPAQHLSISQLFAIESTKGSVERWLARILAPSSREQSKRFTIMGNGALLIGAKKNLQVRGTFMIVIALTVGS